MYKYKFLSLLQIRFCALFTQNIMLIGKKLWNGRYLRKNDIPFNNKTTPSLLSVSPPSLGPTFSIPHPRPTPFHPPPLPQFCHPATLGSRSYLPLLSFCQKYANEIIKIWRITTTLCSLSIYHFERNIIPSHASPQICRDERGMSSWVLCPPCRVWSGGMLEGDPRCEREMGHSNPPPPTSTPSPTCRGAITIYFTWGGGGGGGEKNFSKF